MTTTSSSTSIRNVQYKLLIDMLNCNLPETDLNRPIWKLFIMDRTAQRIVSPILKVNDLREHGVTLFLQFDQEREAVSEVPAVYFVEPTSANITRICQDLRNNLYESFYLNFTSYINRDGLEQLAQASLSTSSHVKIAQIYDQYLNYISLEDSLFSLEIPHVLSALINAPSSQLLDQLASGLFSVCMSFGGLAPVLCAVKPASKSSLAARESLSQTLVSRLESRIKSHLINTKSACAMTPQSGINPTASRPLLIVADRFLDLAGPIKHSSAYNALIDDILGLQANKVTLSAPVSKSFDIDMRDWIWRENAAKPFPNVAEAVESALKTYKSDYDRVMQTTPGMTDELMKQNSTALTPEQLKVAINVLPELTDRKRLIDTHLQISTALLDAIKTRDLGNLFHLEQSIASLTPGALMNALRDPKIGNGRDKLRLLLVFLLARGFAGSGIVVEEAVKLCEAAGCSPAELSVVSLVKSLNLENVNTSPVLASAPTSAPAANEASIGDFLSRLSAGGGAVLGSLVSSVKNLLPASADTPLSRLVDEAFAAATGQSPSVSPLGSPLNSPVDASLSLSGRLQVVDPRPKAVSSVYSVDHVILVLLGGAGYSEYDHLLEHFSKAKHLQSVKFTFGTNEMMNAARFLQELSSLVPKPQ